MAGRSRPGLFVMEGKWSSRVRDVRSVDPVLKALDEAGAAIHVKHHLNDRDDLVRQLDRWGQGQHDRYRIGYVAFHGSPATVYIGRYKVRLEELGLQLRTKRLRDKYLHFGSCSVLAIDEDERQRLRSALGVKVLTGFTTDVDWFESMAFELLLFDALAYYARPYDAMKYLEKTHGAFAERLGFVMVR